MLILRQRYYSKLDKLKEFGQAFKDSPLVPAASLGLSATAVTLSASRNKQLKEQNEKQLDAMNRLTRSLTKVDKSLDSISRDDEEKSEKKKEKKNLLDLFKK